ncbi:hypothetical protein BDK51DRAFT_29812, partial [Blyttiomyces helicus]
MADDNFIPFAFEDTFFDKSKPPRVRGPPGGPKNGDGSYVPPHMRPGYQCVDVLVPLPLPPWVPEGRVYSSDLVEMLEQEVQDYVEFMNPTDAEHEMRLLTVNRLTKLINELWPRARVHVFGSFETKLYLPSSDVDIVIMDPTLRLPTCLHELEAWLRKNNAHKAGTEITKIPSAKVPILKLTDSLTHYPIDISFNVDGGVKAIQIVNEFVSDPRTGCAIRPLMLILKQFLLQRHLNEPHTGGIGSYGLLTLTASFLKLHPKLQTGVIKADEHLGLLFLEFLELYGHSFNFRDVGIAVTREHGSWYFDKNRQNYVMKPGPSTICVIDPQDSANDIGRSTRKWFNIKSSFMHACNLLTAMIGKGYERRGSKGSEPVVTLLGSILSIRKEVMTQRAFIHGLYEDINGGPDSGIGAPGPTANGQSKSVPSSSRGATKRKRLAAADSDEDVVYIVESDSEAADDDMVMVNSDSDDEKLAAAKGKNSEPKSLKNPKKPRTGAANGDDPDDLADIEAYYGIGGPGHHTAPGAGVDDGRGPRGGDQGRGTWPAVNRGRGGGSRPRDGRGKGYKKKIAMTSLIIPLSCWTSAPTGAVTLAVASDDGKTLIIALAGGSLWLLETDPRGEPSRDSQFGLVHKALLVGHKASISAISLGKIEIEGFTANENIILTAAEDGEVIMWDISDGRCLQANASAFDGVPQSLEMTSSGKFVVCSGYSNRISILDASTLDTVKTLTPYDNWISSMSLYPTARVEFVPENIPPLAIHSDGGTPPFLVQVNHYDKNLILVLQKRSCSIFAIGKKSASLLSVIAPVPVSAPWSGARFLSARTLMLWTSAATLRIFYLGPESDLTRGAAAAIPPTAVVLFSDETSAIWVQDMAVGEKDYVSYSAIEPIATLMTPKPSRYSITCPLGPLRVLSLHGAEGAEREISVWSFWAMLTTRSTTLCVFENEEIPLKSTWPITRRNAPRMTSAIMVMNKYLAIGLGRDIGERSILVSGGADGTVRVWNLETGETLTSFPMHTQRVQAFVQPPSEVGPKMRSCIISISKDHSIGITDFDDLHCIYRFTGHSHAINAIHWRTSDEIMIVECCNGTIYVWQLKTGHLDRVATGGIVEDILGGCDCKVSCKDFTLGFRNANLKKTLSVLPVHCASEDPPPALVFQLNIKRLITELHNGALPATPPTSPPAPLPPAGRPSRNRRSSSPSRPRTPSHSSGHHVADFFRRGVAAVSGGAVGDATAGASGSEHDRGREREREKEREAEREREREKDRERERERERMREGTDIVLVGALHNALMAGRAGVAVSGGMTFGIRGANGYLSLAAPSTDLLCFPWSVSPTMTAARLLSIMALTKTAMSSHGREERSAEILAFYGTSLPSAVGRSYAFPSFSFLAKYWQDPVPDIQGAARGLFTSVLAQMSTDEKCAIVNYWRPHLPAVTTSPKKNSKMNMRAAMILGIVGSDQPSLLSL